MPSPKSYPDTYLPATAKELAQASATLSKLKNTKQSCGTCKHFLPKTSFVCICSLKDKRISHYNICIEHKGNLK